MSGRVGRNYNLGGRGNSRGRGKGRGQNYTGNTSTTKKGMNEALGTNVFDYGQKAAADQMRTSWEKVTEYVGTTYGQYISNELQNKVAVILPEPVHNAGGLTRHRARESVIRAGQANMQIA